VSDRDPSDPDGAQPINRLALRDPDYLTSLLLGPTSPTGQGGVVVHLDADAGVRGLVPESAMSGRPVYDLPFLNREPVYHMIYTWVRDQVDAGESPKAIRTQLREALESLGKLANAAREALEDALANRPRRYPNHLNP
jgi:hypothetical protein